MLTKTISIRTHLSLIFVFWHRWAIDQCLSNDSIHWKGMTMLTLSDGAATIALTLWVPQATDGGAGGGRKWQIWWIVVTLWELAWLLIMEKHFVFFFARGVNACCQKSLEGAFRTPGEMHPRGRFPQNTLVEEVFLPQGGSLWSCCRFKKSI